MATRPLIKESLMLLNPYGVDPFINNAFSKLRLVVALFLFLIVCINTVLHVIFKWQGLGSMQSIVILTAFIQLVTKLAILSANRQNLVDVINKMKQFWPINKYGTELKDELEMFYKFPIQILKFMIIFLVFGAVGFFSISAITRALPFPVYYPADLNKSPDYEIAFVFQVLTSYFAIFFLQGFDFFFVSLIINITSELKLVKGGFKNITINPKIEGDDEESLRELYKIIDHHNLIFECIKSVRGIYSFWLLNIYFYNMIEMSVSMLSIIATGISFESLFQNGFLAVIYFMQLFFYCAAGQYLITECESVSTTVYNIEWWMKTQPKFRRALVMVIQRANKMESLTAGGMFALNLQSFRKVTRSAMSFFTLVNAVYKDTS